MRWFLFLAMGCKSLAVAGGPCKTTAQCASGLFCISGKCAATECASNTDCAAGAKCDDSTHKCVSTQTCQDTCTQEGAAACNGNAISVCQRNASGCLALAPTPCPATTPACDAQTVTCVCTINSCGAPDNACDAATGACVACATQTVGSQIYVDVSSTVTPVGTAACPLNSITAALALPQATGGAINIAAGTYDANVETFPLHITAGMTLTGAGADKTTILGDALIDLPTHAGFFGDGSVAADVCGFEANCPNVAIWVNTDQPVTVSGVTVAPDPAKLDASWGLMCDRGSADAGGHVSNWPAPSLVVDSTTFSPGWGWDAGIYSGGSPASGCNALFTNSTFTGDGAGANNGIWAAGAGSSAGINQHEVAIAIGAPGGDNGNTFTGLSSGANFWDGTSPAWVEGNTFENGAGGIGGVQHSVTGTSIPATEAYYINNVFQNLTSYGVSSVLCWQIIELMNNTFQNISAGASSGTGAAGALFDASGSCRTNAQKARNNVFAENDRGVEFQNGWESITLDSFYGALFTDFGKTTDHGNNQFVCNSFPTIVGPIGADVLFDSSSGLTTAPENLTIDGNIWNHAPPQVSNGNNGTDIWYPTGHITDNAYGTPITTCPNGFTP